MVKKEGYQYGGLQFGKECWASNFKPDNNQKDDSECNMPCRTDKTIMCGAAHRNSVYHQSNEGPKTYQTILNQTQSDNLFNYDGIMVLEVICNVFMIFYAIIFVFYLDYYALNSTAMQQWYRGFRTNTSFPSGTQTKWDIAQGRNG